MFMPQCLCWSPIVMPRVIGDSLGNKSIFFFQSGRLDREKMAVGPLKWVVAVALDRWSPLAGKIYSKNDGGTAKVVAKAGGRP